MESTWWQTSRKDVSGGGFSLIGVAADASKFCCFGLSDYFAIVEAIGVLMSAALDMEAGGCIDNVSHSSPSGDMIDVSTYTPMID